jgi:23S rRNA pseudouridine2605 synthase
MRINKFIALATGLSRRAADKLADAGEIFVNNRPIKKGHEIIASDQVTLKGQTLQLPKINTIILNKPVGFVCSRNGQGNKTIYELLPKKYHTLKPVGRLDKNSSGLLLLTNNGDLAQRLTHPRYVKEKLYSIELDQNLKPEDRHEIKHGVDLEDGPSRLMLQGQDRYWRVKMFEGRNRQIRRTFNAMGYEVVKLHRTKFGQYSLGNLSQGKFKQL